MFNRDQGNTCFTEWRVVGDSSDSHGQPHLQYAFPYHTSPQSGNGSVSLTVYYQARVRYSSCHNCYLKFLKLHTFSILVKTLTPFGLNEGFL